MSWLPSRVCSPQVRRYFGATFDTLAENAGIFDFELTAEEVSELDRLHDGFRSSWDPTAVT